MGLEVVNCLLGFSDRMICGILLFRTAGENRHKDCSDVAPEWHELLLGLDVYMLDSDVDLGILTSF